MATLNMEIPKVEDFIPFAISPGTLDMSDRTERFFRHFQADATLIQEQIDDMTTVSPVNGERKDCIDQILASISRLNKEVIDAGEYIPAYDQRAYAKAVKGLTEKLNEAISKLEPKPRFQFKRRTTPALSSTTAADPRPYAPSTPSTSYTTTSTGTDQPSSASSVLQESQPPSKDNNSLPTSASRATPSSDITEVDRSVIIMRDDGPRTGLAIKNVRHSLIVVGRVNGAAHLTDLRDSIVVVSARQVRIHECHNVNFYLFCSSHPIIEDCQGVRFAPIPDSLLAEEQRTETNQWDQVDDFKWLKSEPSPNWAILPEEKRLSEAEWTDVIDSDYSVEDKLHKLGIAA